MPDEPRRTGPWPGAPGGPAGLSRGAVEVRLEPVRSDEHAGALTAAIAGIRGVAGTSGVTARGRELGLVVHIARPLPLGSELRRALAREMRTCTVRDGCFHVELDPSAPVTGRAGVRPAGPTATATTEGPPAPPRGGPPAGIARDGGTAAPPQDLGGLPDAFRDVIAGVLGAMDADSIVVFDRDLRFRAVAGSAHQGGDHAAENLLGRAAAHALPASVWAVAAPAYGAALRGEGATFDHEQDDAVLEVTCRPVLRGELVVGGVAVARDVAERRRDERFVAELREVFDLIFAGSPVRQALLSPEGRWLRVNAALCRLLGRDEAALVGRDALETTHPDDRAAERDLLQAVRDGDRDGYAVERRLRPAAGPDVPVRVQVSVVRGADGAVRGLVAQVLDAGGAREAAAERSVASPSGG